MREVKITSKNSTLGRRGKYSVDASELGWRPGHYCMEVSTDLGNKTPFQLMMLDDDGFIYFQEGSDITLTVWND